MSLPYRQQRRLDQMDRELRRSDPHLAAMLSIFARLAAGQVMPAQERVPGRWLLAWGVLIWLVITVGRWAVQAPVRLRGRRTAPGSRAQGPSSGSRPPRTGT